ncbi:MAG: UvrD-helicase domain-containing protein [Chlamydiales bacterium]|nr:UvrD-helicase domain-containing protein [Chlamydiia bacterium]MCP5508304.1 UvrD-helicase domain-containing protein [Chlamydiales bacterium]
MTSTSQSQIDLLNPEQKRAVKTVDGRVLILAGAGSGKTRVLTMRMVYLVATLGVPPESILGLTFTNKAAAEMRSRIAGMVDRETAKRITLCTFHSFCMKILRQEIDKLGYTPNFTLYDEKDVYRLATTIARDILGIEGELPSLASSLAAIGRARSQGLKSEEISGMGSEWFDGFTQQLYERLQRSLRAYNAVDFDSLLTLTVDLFEKCPDVLAKYQNLYRYVMIDEYQDTNPIQYRLAELLTSSHNNLCVVGDDDQSIYGWRGADVKNILRFSDAAVIKLQQNYRSTNSILTAANAVIKNNEERHDKQLWSERGDGMPIELFHAPTEQEEAQAVVCRIAKLKELHALKWSDIAILYRSNALSRNFETALMRHTWRKHDRWVTGIPYQVYGGVEFYERREVKDLFAYLRVIVNSKDQEALLRVINTPRRGIGDKALGALTQYNRTHHVALWEVLERFVNDQIPEVAEHISSRAKDGILNFLATIQAARQRFAEEPLHEAMRWLVERIDYKKAIKDEVKSDQMRTFKWENVEEFVSALADFEEQFLVDEERPATLIDYVTNSPLRKDTDHGQKNKDVNSDQMHLLTFHSAKGLEFKACFLVGMEDHIMPHEKSLMETGIEEERRLMYVAITRAMQFLTISMARQRKRMGKECPSLPSRFLHEIPKELLRITQWHDVK